MNMQTDFAKELPHGILQQLTFFLFAEMF